ncbi:MAG: MATE family efflux transporter [Firmicutes bacterium]|nr:MATE family efflux transporter [Bacillota bacterium]
MKKQVTTFTEGPILMPLIRFALPVLAALFLQTMYGAVDLLVVGQYSNAGEVSAVSTGSQLMNSLTVVVTGLSMGITIMIGQYIGQKRPEKAAQTIGNGISLFLVVTVMMTIGIIALAGPLAALLQAPEEAFDSTVAYIRICASGFLFIVGYNLLGSIFRGIGDSKMPLITVAIACVVNIFGDLLLVAVFKMGAAGAAIATVAAQAISVVLSLIIIAKRPLPFTFSLKAIRFEGKMIKKILGLGTPVALQDLLVSISFLVIMAIVNAMGVIASAGVGVAEKLCGFIMLVPSAFMQSMSAFVAQNVGAGKWDRARKTLWYGVGASAAVGVMMFYVSFFHGDLLSGLFAKDAQVIAASVDYLRSYAIDTLLTSFLFCFIGYFNGCGKTFFVMIQGLVGAFLVRIPVAFLISRISGATLFMIGLATPSSTIVQIVLCMVYYVIVNRKNK